jgi:hypothetical protein
MYRRLLEEERGSGGEWGRTRRSRAPRHRRRTGARAAEDQRTRGRSRELRRDAIAEEKEQSRDVATVYHFTAPPVFTEPATPTPPPQHELTTAVLLLPPSLASFLSCGSTPHRCAGSVETRRPVFPFPCAGLRAAARSMTSECRFPPSCAPAAKVQEGNLGRVC